MPTPSDADAVLTALRLGWALAELRGRYRLDAPDPSKDAIPENPAAALPLRRERDATDQRAETAAILNAVLTKLTRAHKALNTDPSDGKAVFSTEIESATAKLDGIADKKGDAAQSAWTDFAQLLLRFDGHVQNVLTSEAEQQSCAYLLGRGLAESYWALDPAAEMPESPEDPVTDATSWAFLLGEARRDELSRLLGRLAPYFNRYTAPAISGSLVVWHRVVTTDDWRKQKGASDDLYLQVRRWYGLLLIGQDPTTLIKPFAMLRNLRGAWNAIRLFLPQLLFGALSIAALFGVVWAANTTLGKSIGVAVGALGLSLTTLAAKAKSSAQALTARLKDDAYTDLVAIAITVVPPRSEVDEKGRRRQLIPKSVASPTRRAVSSALRDRRLTTAVAP
jgi:hypothetical protein